jgi:hypothetical protein
MPARKVQDESHETLPTISYDEYSALEQAAKYGEDAKGMKWFDERQRTSSRTVKMAINILTTNTKSKPVSQSGNRGRARTSVEEGDPQLAQKIAAIFRTANSSSGGTVP